MLSLRANFCASWNREPTIVTITRNVAIFPLVSYHRREMTLLEELGKRVEEKIVAEARIEPTDLRVVGELSDHSATPLQYTHSRMR